MNAVSNQKRKYEQTARAERQRETRRRIVEAAVALHQEVGPARTTVAEIARRVGVQRLTVYNHFPDEDELFGACAGHYFAMHPPPDLGGALALEEPEARVRAALGALYGWYRSTEPMLTKVYRDRALVPAVGRRWELTLGAQLAELAAALAGGFRGRGGRAEALGAIVRLAVDLQTWGLLTGEGLSDREAADLMADAVAALDAGPVARRRSRG